MSGEVVVDASVAVKWVVTEPLTREARDLLAGWLQTDVARLAPCWFACEVANVLYRRTVQGLLTLDDAGDALDDILAFVSLQTERAPLARRALAIAQLTARPTTYDAQYAALAEAEGCELWTADERFYNTARGSFPFVHWLGEVAGP